MITTDTMNGGSAASEQETNGPNDTGTNPAGAMLPDDLARLMAERNKPGLELKEALATKPGLPLHHVEGARLPLNELRDWARSRGKAISDSYKSSEHRDAMLGMLAALISACEKKLFEGVKGDAEHLAQLVLDWDQSSDRFDSSWMLKPS